MAQPETKDLTLSIPNWSLLFEELLKLISTHLKKQNTSFFVDTIHARSVCNSWLSTFSFPSRSLLRQNFSLPSFSKFPQETKELCTLQKIPLFLFRLKTQTQTQKFLLGGISQDDHMELLPSPVQCSLKANLQDPILMNMLDCQILPLGHHIKIIGLDPENMYKNVAFLQEGERFVVLLNYSSFLLVLRSSEMKWIRVESMSIASCSDLYTFKGKFYAVFLNGDIFVIDPYSLEVNPLMLAVQQVIRSSKDLVPCGDDEELFLVERYVPSANNDDVVDFDKLACRVSKLDVETGEWIAVSDLGDRVLFIGEMGNVACSGKELPDGCGLSKNSILFTNWPEEVTYMYKYGGNEEDDLGFRSFAREFRVLLLNRAPPVIAFHVESNET